MTIIENLVFSHPKYLALGENPDKKDAQRVLDEISEEVLSSVQPEEIVAHVCKVYSAMAAKYAAEPYNKDIFDELIYFMELLPEDGEVLDLGCGHGLDTMFMVGNREFRKGVMGKKSADVKTTLEKCAVPTKTFRVTAIDNSTAMLDVARENERQLIRKGLLASGAMPPLVAYEDMHNINRQWFGPFDGIWSCTALFAHTPKKMIERAMASVARQLKPGGVLFVSYTNGRSDGRYNKLLLSETGRIKYFSQPDHEMIEDVAHDYGLFLMRGSLSDMKNPDGNLIKQDLFASQFYRKYN